MLWNRIAFITTFLFFALSLASGQSPSVGPLTLGMNLTTAQQKLGGPYQLQLENRDAFNIVDYDASKDGYKGNLGIIHDGYALQFTGNRLDYVEHSVDFAAGTEPRLDKTIAQLLEKYGTSPTSRSNKSGFNDAIYIEWVWDSSGVISHDPAKATLCDVPTDAKSIRTSHNYLLSFPIRFQGQCAITLRVGLAVSSDDPSLLSSFSVYLIDHRVPAAAIQAQHNTNSAPL